MVLKIKRVTEPLTKTDGARVLVDRLWPRGQSKAELQLTAWLRDIAPSSALREWFGHDPKKWEAFRNRYRSELDANSTAVKQLRALLKQYPKATLLFAARDEEHNNAAVLAEYLREGSRRHAAP